MKSETNAMMNILYSPIMYIHPDRLFELKSSKDILTDVILNHWIINNYQLEHLPNNWEFNDALSIFIFNHWYHILRAAELIGGYLFREQFLIEKLSLLKDPKLLSFISLPLRYSVAISHPQPITSYPAWGAAFITNLAQNLPIALRQRLSLCFSQNIPLPQCHIAKTPDNINLLRIAIHYAHNTKK